MGHSTVRCAETAEPIMPFWKKTRVGPRNNVLDRGADPPRGIGNFGGLSGPFKSIGNFRCNKRKENERKSIHTAPFIYYVYLKALRHGSHSFTCKYTMPAHPSYAFTRWRHPNWGRRHPIAAYYLIIDPDRMKDWVGLAAKGIIQYARQAQIVFWKFWAHAMRPIGRERSGGIALHGRSVISTIAVFAVCSTWRGVSITPHGRLRPRYSAYLW